MGSGSYVALPFVQRAEDPKALISVGSVCVVLATISVGLRMFTKWKFVGKIRADDWLMVWSLVMIKSVFHVFQQLTIVVQMLFGVYCSCVIVGGSLVAKPDEKPLQASELALSVNVSDVLDFPIRQIPTDALGAVVKPRRGFLHCDSHVHQNFHWPVLSTDRSNSTDPICYIHDSRGLYSLEYCYDLFRHLPVWRLH